jgi:hypothetical protein
MRLVYLPANAAWAFVFGPINDPSRWVVTGASDGTLFHATRADAVTSALASGLHVTRSGELVTLDCHHEFGAHSADLVSVYYGELKPARVCGRHHRDGLTSATYDVARYRHDHES